jgi:hypothetical protein
VFANCTGKGASFEYVNFRGAHFSKSTFKQAIFKGCDFWGTTFKKCSFNGTVFLDCVFQGCKFKDCDFNGAIIQYSVIVNTNLDECKEINLENTTLLLNQYPKIEIGESLLNILEELKCNNELRKTKILWISNKKMNNLNLYLLMRKYSEQLIVDYLQQLSVKEIRKLTTYGSLNLGLRKYKKRDIM